MFFGSPLGVFFPKALIRRNQGWGTFITPRLEQPLSRLSGFSEMLRLKGFVPGSQWLEREITPPTHEELIRLCLSPTDKVARLKRLRKADDTVMAIEMSTLPASIMPRPQAVGDSLYEYLDGIGKPIVRALQHIPAINASDEFAALVGIDPGTATTGYGIIDVHDGEMEMVAYGTIETSSKLPMTERLVQIYDEITQLTRV